MTLIRNRLILNLIFLTCLAVSAPAEANTCQWHFASATQKRTPSPTNSDSISHTSLMLWPRAAWQKVLRVSQYYKNTAEQSYTVEQIAFEPQDFSRQEQSLIRTLQNKSKSRKATLRGTWNSFKNRMQELLQARKDLSPEEIRRQSHIYIHEYPRNSVEYGAFRITFKDGSVHTALHTSSHYKGIDSVERTSYTVDKLDLTETTREVNAIVEAFDLLFINKNLSYDQIAMIQYFHTHASASALSKADIELIQSIKQQAREDMWGDIPVLIYAIVETNAELTGSQDTYILQHGL